MPFLAALTRGFALRPSGTLAGSTFITTKGGLSAHSGGFLSGRRLSRHSLRQRPGGSNPGGSLEFYLVINGETSVTVPQTGNVGGPDPFGHGGSRQ